jgi:hypothetical protein
MGFSPSLFGIIILACVWQSHAYIAPQDKAFLDEWLRFGFIRQRKIFPCRKHATAKIYYCILNVIYSLNCIWL